MKIENNFFQSPIHTQTTKQQLDESKTNTFEQALKTASEQGDDLKLKDACDQLEGYMLSEIFKRMKKSVESEDGLIPKGDYEKTFESYLTDTQCKTMVEAGGVGLSKMLYDQMTKTRS